MAWTSADRLSRRELSSAAAAEGRLRAASSSRRGRPSSREGAAARGMLWRRPATGRQGNRGLCAARRGHAREGNQKGGPRVHKIGRRSAHRAASGSGPVRTRAERRARVRARDWAAWLLRHDAPWPGIAAPLMPRVLLLGSQRHVARRLLRPRLHALPARQDGQLDARAGNGEQVVLGHLHHGLPHGAAA